MQLSVLSTTRSVFDRLRRAPFLSGTLLALCLALPVAAAPPPDGPKIDLVKLADGRYQLGNIMIDREKQAFTVPGSSWQLLVPFGMLLLL